MQEIFFVKSTPLGGKGYFALILHDSLKRRRGFEKSHVRLN